MKWFKHLSNSRTDEKLVALLYEAGMEGYGFWWMIVEIVAEQMDSSGKCHATYSLPQWSHMLYSHHNKVSKVLSKLGVIGLVNLEYPDRKIKVTIPNILKFRDEYSKKSGQSPDNLRSKKEKEKEKEKEITTMTLSQVRDLFQECAGVNVVNGGQVVVFQNLIRRFTPEAITEAFHAAAANPDVSAAGFLNWCVSRLERKRDAPQEESFTDFLDGLAAKAKAEGLT